MKKFAIVIGAVVVVMALILLVRFEFKKHSVASAAPNSASSESIKFLVGKWVVKGGSPYFDAYTFNADNTFSYLYDDYAFSGKFSYKDGVITLNFNKEYNSDQVTAVSEVKTYSLIVIDSNIVTIGDKPYKNIVAIGADESWYDNGGDNNDNDDNSDADSGSDN